MIIVRVVGGLGNQLYCYAMYRYLQSLGREVKLDIADYLPGAREPEKRDLELLKLIDEEAISSGAALATPAECADMKDDSRAFFTRVRRKLFGSKSKLYQEHKAFDENIPLLTDAYLNGYWNCEGYYADILPLLRSAIRFPVERPDYIDAIRERSEDYENAQENLLLALQMSASESCAVHLRRTDYLDPSTGGRYSGICTDAYYQSAISKVRALSADATFYVFSDDIEYAKEYFADEKRAIFVSHNRGRFSMYDMYLMKQCKYHICANSTFSIWGARLSAREDKVMYRPLYHDQKEKQAITPADMKSYWKNWHLIDAEGNEI